MGEPLIPTQISAYKRLELLKRAFDYGNSSRDATGDDIEKNRTHAECDPDDRKGLHSVLFSLEQ
jgi:hypothetical protein